MDRDASRTDSLGPDPRRAAPSVVPGLTQAEFDDLAADLLWWDAVPLGERLRAARRLAREDRLLQRLAAKKRGG